MAIDAHLLQSFRVVVEAGRISAAARLLHRSQPAVTAQIRQLEEQCGQPLLIRSARGVLPTEAGRRLVAYAEQVSVLLDEAAGAMAAASERGGELHLGASTTIAARVLPIVLARFGRIAPVRMRVEESNTDEITARVRDGRLPLGLVEGLSRAAGLRLEPFLADELVPVVARDAPPELRRLVRAHDLGRVPIVWREPGSGTRSVVERALRRALGRREPHPRDVTLGSTESIKTAVLLGLGVAFLSRWSMRDELALGRLEVLTLKDLRIARNFSWALPAAEVTGVAGRFLRFARLEASSLAP